MRIIIPGLNYADMLAVTLPAWRALLPDAMLVAVCGLGDRETYELARAHGAVAVGTDRWTADGASLNKAQVIELVLPYGDEGEPVVIADADCVPFGTLPELEADTLYGCARYECQTPEQLDAHRRGLCELDLFPLIPPRRRGLEIEWGRSITAAQAAAACTGYFQAFRYRPGLTFGSYPTAAGYDTAFRQQFSRCVGLTEFYVLHLGELSRENWKGRVVPKWPASSDGRSAINATGR